MKRLLLSFAVLLILPAIATAYTLVLKDGKRIEVKPQYRIVGELVVFSYPDGHRFSVPLANVSIEETELANGLMPGSFVKNVTEPPKIGEKTTQPSQANQADSPFVGRVTKKKITNADFEAYKARRLETERELQRRELDRMAADPTYVPYSAARADEAERLASAMRREREKAKEEYWRGRTRELLTQFQVVEDQIAIITAQIEQNRTPVSPPITSIYNPPGLGISIGGLPIWVGRRPWGGWGGNSTVVINNQPNMQQTRAMNLQERLTDLLMRRQELIVQYDRLLEEGRKAGALPGWLR